MIYDLLQCRFPREDEAAPRQAILVKFCSSGVTAFRACMTANNYSEANCLPEKKILDSCASAAFK